MMKCTGCSACAVICPQNCIEMKMNEDGFLRPQVDIEKCSSCNLCNTVCVVNASENIRSLDDGVLYYAWSRSNETRLSTTSGGIAHEIALQGVKSKKCVVGVAFNKDLLKAEHIQCFDLSEIEKLKGSKYLQSDSENSFKKIVAWLKTDDEREAIIFGTPCQIQGMSNILERLRLRNRVTLVDIFCHGVPSMLLWENYLKWLEKEKKLDLSKLNEIQFRDKRYSWHNYFMHIWTKDKEYVSSREKDPFLKLFSMGVFNQKECFTCEFRNKSGADIRLGDFWGERFKEQEEGYSMVLVQTKRGKEIFRCLNNIIYEEVSILERYGQQHVDYEIPTNYKIGFDMLKNGASIKRLVKLYDPLTRRIARRIKCVVKKVLIK